VETDRVFSVLASQVFDPLPDGGLPVVETEQSAAPFATNDATGSGHVHGWLEQ